MTANDIFRDTRVAHVRELKAEVARLKEELARVRDARESLDRHFALALAAVCGAAAGWLGSIVFRRFRKEAPPAPADAAGKEASAS